MAKDLDIEVVFGDLTRSDLYVADEVFLVGTAAEVSAVSSVDDREIPCPGPVTTAIGPEYAKVVRDRQIVVLGKRLSVLFFLCGLRLLYKLFFFYLFFFFFFF